MERLFNAIDNNLNIDNNLKKKLKNVIKNINNMIPAGYHNILLESLQNVTINFSDSREVIQLGIIYNSKDYSIVLSYNIPDSELEKSLTWGFLHYISDFSKNYVTTKRIK